MTSYSQGRISYLHGMSTEPLTGMTVGQLLDVAVERFPEPTKVVRTALENAVSVAGILLLTEATMIEVEEGSDKRHEVVPEGI